MRNKLGLLVVLALGTFLVFGCGKKKDEQPMIDPTPPPAEGAAEVEAVKADVEKAAADVKGAAEKAGAEVQAAGSQLQAQVDTVIAEAQKLLAAKSYQEALAKLQQGLAIPGLTAEQQQALKKLVEEAQKTAAGQAATGAVRNLLNPNK